jgi:hypothetical protein
MSAALQMNARVTYIMTGPVDVVIQTMAAMDFDRLQKMQEEVLTVAGKHSQRSEMVARGLFKKRMAELTALQPWPAPRGLTMEEIDWLGSAGVRTQVHLTKKLVKLEEHAHGNADELIPAHTIVWCINGESRLAVNINGEFWMAPAGTPVPAPIWVSDQVGLNIPLIAPFPIMVPDLGDDAIFDDSDDNSSVDTRDHPQYRLIHRVGGPAVRDSAGFVLWARHGMPHRTDGPAMVRPLVHFPGDNAGLQIVGHPPRGEREELYFFRGMQVANQDALRTAAAAAAPDPAFDGDVDDTSAALLLQPHMVQPPEWLAAQASMVPRPLPRPMLLKDPPFAPNATLDRLLRSRVPVNSIEFPIAAVGRPHMHVLQLRPAKPLGDVMREDLCAFFSQRYTEAEASRQPIGVLGNVRVYVWASYPETAMAGFMRVLTMAVHNSESFAPIVAVDMPARGEVRLRISINPDAPEAAWTLPDEEEAGEEMV